VILGPIAVLLVQVSAPGSEPHRLDACKDEPVVTATASDDAMARGLVASAVGYEELRRGSLEASVRCLTLAVRLLPDVSIVRRDLAIAFFQQGQLAEALTQIDQARKLGETDLSLDTLEILVLGRLGRWQEALAKAEGSQTPMAQRLGAVLGGEISADGLKRKVRESGHDAYLDALALSAYAARQGQGAVALLLIDGLDSPDISLTPTERASVRRFRARIDDKARDWVPHFRLQSTVDAVSNPLYQSSTNTPLQNTLRLAFAGEGYLAYRVGEVTLSASARFDQQLVLVDRASFQQGEIGAFSVSGGLEVPFGVYPAVLFVGLSVRYTDVFGDLYRVHVGQVVEGGPFIRMRMAAGWNLRLSVLGTAFDFSDFEPSSEQVRATQRDRVGQRVGLSLLYGDRFIDAAIDGLFLNDIADGQAFDAIGGGVAARVDLQATTRIRVGGGFSVMGRQYGPVGEQSVIGSAATRAELRAFVEAHIRYRMYGGMDVLLEDRWIQNTALVGHRYAANVVSLGVVNQW
jgi:tetratricopeptide (TPR) repeat protein